MKILAIDPGTSESAWAVLDGARLVGSGKQPNADVLQLLRVGFRAPDLLAVEMIASYGMAVGAEVFQTCVWIGRFVEAWSARDGRPVRLVFRRDAKLHLCGQARAKDPNVRQAILDRYGGKAAAMGRKAAPGPLYGVSGDVWAALAVAITATETPEAAPATDHAKAPVAHAGPPGSLPDALAATQAPRNAATGTPGALEAKAESA